MSKINIMALGGLDEKNKNMYVLEIDSKIYILDSGIYKPLNSTFGIQHFVPNIDYLKENADKIKGVFLSSANRQQIAAIVQIIKAFPNIKIYGSNVTLNSLFIFFPKHDFRKNIVILKNGERKNIGGVDVSTIELNSAIPGNFGYVFNTEDGNVFYFVDYLFDWIQEYNIPLLNELQKYSNQNNLLFLSDSLNMEIEHSISPQYSIIKYIKDSFKKKKRIVSFTYENELINIIELINLARKYKRKVFVLDHEIIKLLELVFDSGYSEPYHIHPITKYKKEDENNSVVIVTGTQTSLYKLMTKILVENNSNWFSLTKNDILLLSSGPQPGNEDEFQSITSKISRIEADTIVPDFENKPMIHPSQFDLKNYLKFLNPKYFMPIKGYFKELSKAKEFAVSLGIDKKNILIGDNGEEFTILNGQLLNETRKISSVGAEIIEIISENTIDSEIIEQRQSIGKDGVLTAFVAIDKNTRKIISNIDIQMRGVIYIKNQEKLITDLELEIKNTLEENEKEKNLNKIVSNINKSFIKILKSSIKKTPKIVIKIKVA